ncbi:MAG: tetratricopeptide repeat protein [Anaerolineae bacterium]|nr:tetratricopeptide repeat protein [Anaerolineae bacterium]
MEIAEEGLQQALSTQQNYYIAGLYTNAGEAHYYLGHFDKAVEYASKAIQRREEIHLPSAYIVMGMTQRSMSAFVAADQSLTLAIEIAGQTEDKYALAAAWRELGELRICQHRKNDAKNALTQSITLFRELYNEPQANEIEARLNAL